MDLNRVEKPARYTGGEYNSVMKEEGSYRIRYAFCFPDTYEVGMSHLGLRILYGLLNEREDTYCQRVFAPWTDMEALMREEGVPLLTIEKQEPIHDFDFVGFTLQYELSYTNILNMLDLAGIPLLAADRGEAFPIVYAGGPCAYNPEPLAEIMDFFMLGEGEELTNEVMDIYAAHKGTKEEFLEKIAELEGIYVPSFYDVTYKADGTVAAVTPNRPCAKPQIRKRIIMDLDKAYFPTKTMVPYLDVVHDRMMLEIFRGCTRGCRFCQAGVVYRPVRERSPERLLELAREMIASSGYEEMSLTSLSTSDYTELPALCDGLLKLTEEKKINLSLPSLRLDNFSMELMQKTQKVRKSGLTFAPEAGTQRLRDVINKNITEEDLLRAARTAFAGGYSGVKLYFMMGLPTETEEDILGISALATKVADEYFATPREARGKGLTITVSTSCFVPKPHTPFQWEPQDSIASLRQKQSSLKQSIKSRFIKYNWHEATVSYLEGVFARGDRRLSRVLIEAQRKGCKFDGWTETFDFDRWMGVFADCGIDPDFYAARRREEDEVFPWDHIFAGGDKSFLLREKRRAYEEKTTPQCREACSKCGAHSFGGGVCIR